MPSTNAQARAGSTTVLLCDPAPDSFKEVITVEITIVLYLIYLSLSCVAIALKIVHSLVLLKRSLKG